MEEGTGRAWPAEHRHRHSRGAGTGTATRHCLHKLLPSVPQKMYFYDWEGTAEGRGPAQEYKAAAELMPRHCRHEKLTLSGLKTFHAVTLTLKHQGQAHETAERRQAVGSRAGFKSLSETVLNNCDKPSTPLSPSPCPGASLKLPLTSPCHVCPSLPCSPAAAPRSVPFTSGAAGRRHHLWVCPSPPKPEKQEKHGLCIGDS